MTMQFKNAVPALSAALLALLAAVVPAAADGVAVDGHTMILKSDGTLRAAGPNDAGQLGTGDNWQRELFCPVPGAAGFDRVWSAGQVTIARKPDGSLWGCGNPVYKQLGTGGGADFSELISLGGGWAEIGMGGRFTVGVKSDGTLWSWGVTNSGELGSGSQFGNRATPGQIGTGSDWKSISAGNFHALAIKTGGTLWAWGENKYKQLGDGSAVLRSAPVQIGAFTDWKSVSAGGAHSLGIRTDGSLWTWGDNQFGQLGDGTYVAKSTPIRIGTGTNWLAVSVAASHSLALKTDGSLWAWGLNNSGQLGLGDATNRNAPVRVGTATDWTAIDAGPSNSGGVRNGAIWLWGANSGFQLGETTPVMRAAPAAATFPLRPETTVAWKSSGIQNGQFTGDFPVTAQGDPVSATVTLYNTGSSPLAVGGISAAAGFSAAVTVPASLAPSESLAFSAVLTAADTGDFTGDLTTNSNDADESAFVIHLTGKVLSFDTDGDGDGFSDAAELKLASFGFHWNTAEPASVAAFKDDTARAGFVLQAALQAQTPGRPLVMRGADGTAAITVGFQRSGGLTGFSDVPMGGWEIDPAGRLSVPQTMQPGSGFFRFSLEPLNP